MIKNVDMNQVITKKDCKFCQFYEEDYMPTEMGDVHLEWCHNHNNKYKIDSKKQILSFEIQNCEGFKEKVKYFLRRVEQEYNITILYAVESGSRAWGFFNDDSDYDIRFIYKHNDLKEYLQVTDKYEDVMIFNDGLYDVVGWDIKKALYLHYKSNPSLYEWLNSEYIYVNSSKEIFDDLPEFNHKKLLHHYYNMANNHWKKYCKNYKESTDIILLSKKFLYIIRCILTWNMIYGDITPLINFNQLIGQNIKHKFLKYTTYQNINTLHQLYASYNKENGIPAHLMDEFLFLFENLEKWIMVCLDTMKENTDKYKSVNTHDYVKYNKVFHQILGV